MLLSTLALCSCGTDMRRWDKLILPFKAKDVLRVNISEKINVTSDLLNNIKYTQQILKL